MHLIRTVDHSRRMKNKLVKDIFNLNHHRTSLEDRSWGFFFLYTTKSWIHSDFFTAIFLITPSSRDFSPDCRMCDEIWSRYIVFSAPGRRDDLILDSVEMTNRLAGSSFGMRIQWSVNLSCRSLIVSRSGTWPVCWYRLSLVTWSLNCLIPSMIDSMFSHRCLVYRLMFRWVSRSRSRTAILRWMLL